VDEILRLLAHQLVGSEAKATAVALACCHKSFEDPILDALWGTQDRLFPLLKSLPGDVWNGDKYAVSPPRAHDFIPLNYLDRKTFIRLPTTLEWARFRKYARRMQTLVEPGNLDTLSLDLFAVLQFCTINKPLFPNLKSLRFWNTLGEFIPFIPLFLSSRTTAIDIEFCIHDTLPNAAIASMITTFPTLCPNLHTISLNFLPRDLIIADAASELLLNINRDALRNFHVDSPLTEEAREVIHKLPNLCGLTVVVEGSTSLPTMVLPNLTEIDVEYDHNYDWLEGFRGATLGKLDSVTFRAISKSALISDFLEAFESIGLATSTTLSILKFYTHRSWRPNYRSLLSFKLLRELEIEFSCGDNCSSTIDDNILADIARAMPKLETLRLGYKPCGTPTGVTANGPAVLARHCLNLLHLRIHFRVNSLSTLLAIHGPPRAGSTAPRRDCALTDLDVGQIPIAEESTMVVALTLVRIFPHIRWIGYFDQNWGEVLDAIRLSGQIVDC
jgi:hypothetical protein